MVRASIRKKKPDNYKSFKLTRRIRPTYVVPPARVLLRDSLRLLLARKVLFGGILLIYALLYLLFVQGLGGNIFDIGEVKDSLSDAYQGSGEAFVTALTLFGALVLTGSSAPDEVSGLYQAILLIVVSLAAIWAIRQLHGRPDARVTVRDTFYKGMTPLVPALVVVLVMLLQLLPAVVGLSLYNIAKTAGLAISGLEHGIWLTLLGALSVLSFYMLTSSVLALYIVTLPNVRPMQALRTARKLVLHHRLIVARRLLLLPILILLLAAAILLPLILWLEVLVQPVYYAISLGTLLVVHAYLYNLYRSLL